MSAHVTVLFVRHASHGLLGRTLVGRMPGVQLDEGGREQARRLADALGGGAGVSAVYSSPTERARQTAEPVAARFALPVRIEDALDEIDFGDWTGADLDTLDADPRWHGWNAARAEGRPPAGEAFRVVGDRVMARVEAWRTAHAGERIVAVSHADVIKAAICRVLGLSPDRHGAFEIGPASVSTVVLWHGDGKVLELNRPPPPAGAPA